MRRALLLALLGFAGLVAWRSTSAVAGEGEVARGFDPFGPLAAAGYAVSGALGMGLSMKTSDAGVAAIAQHEALRLEPYLDAAGHWTIGYGHLMGPLESGEPITHARALELLRDDVAEAEAAVNALVAVPISQAQFDALVSFVFNVGGGAFRGSTLLRLLNAGDYAGAAEQFQRWNRAGGRVLAGLVSRRAAEARLFETGLA